MKQIAEIRELALPSFGKSQTWASALILSHYKDNLHICALCFGLHMRIFKSKRLDVPEICYQVVMGVGNVQHKHDINHDTKTQVMITLNCEHSPGDSDKPSLP